MTVDIKNSNKIPVWKYIVVILLLIINVIVGYVCVRMYLDYDQGYISEEITEFVNYASLQYKLFQISQLEADVTLPLPVYQVYLSQVADTWGDAREDGRSHEGVDIFATKGTPVFSSTAGYVTRVNFGTLGGNNVFVTGPGGVRYYYAHLERVALGVKVGMFVTPDTVLGFVGTTGNATGTPPHLHLGVYEGRRQPTNPYPLLTDRDW